MENHINEENILGLSQEDRSSWQKPLVSIITVVYNAGKYLEETIKSIVSQKGIYYEYIIIDGGSTDRTVDIIKEYACHINYWISEKDKGIYDAMNKGIDVASGEWIIFMNAGDKFYNSSILAELHKLLLSNVDLIYGHHEIRYGKISTVRKAKSVKLLWKQMIFSHQSLFTRSEIMKKHKFILSYRLAADYEFICNAYVSNKIFVNSNLIISSISAYGESDVHRIESLKERFQISNNYFDNKMCAIYLYYSSRILRNYIMLFIKNILSNNIIFALLGMRYRGQIKSAKK